jgi:hypothetical protein
MAHNSKKNAMTSPSRCHRRGGNGCGFNPRSTPRFQRGGSGWGLSKTQFTLLKTLRFITSRGGNGCGFSILSLPKFPTFTTLVFAFPRKLAGVSARASPLSNSPEAHNPDHRQQYSKRDMVSSLGRNKEEHQLFIASTRKTTQIAPRFFSGAITAHGDCFPPTYSTFGKATPPILPMVRNVRPNLDFGNFSHPSQFAAASPTAGN